MEMLSFSNVKKRFGEKEALCGVSFCVPEHTVFGFVGQNGAGKTTAMKLILGLLKCDEGEIFVNGERVRYGNAKTNRMIGYLPDVPEFYSYMTPEEYLAFCGEISGMRKKEIKERGKKLLQLVGLDAKRRIGGLSRGMKQRLGIAQALLHRPKLLICDEPTSALDPAGRKEILDILSAAKEEAAVLFSTHILSDVEHICDELALLHKGKIALKGDLDKIRSVRKDAGVELELEMEEDMQRLLLRFPFLERGNGRCLRLGEEKRLPEILFWLAESKASVLRIEKQEATLEDLFLEVTGA